MTHKETYKTLCETEGPNIPLFLQYWWMDAVCQGKEWDVMLALDDHGAIAGALPYLIGRKGCFRFVLQPQLTQYNGPWIRPESNSQRVMEDLARQVSRLRLAVFRQNFAPNLVPTPAWEGFDHEARVTYRIADISNPETVFSHFDKSRRQRQIRRAERQLHPVALTPERFAAFHQQYWESRGEKDLLSQPFMTRIIHAALDRGQGILLGLADAEEALIAARFVAFDSHSAYSLLSALHPKHPNGASALLFWLIIQQLSDKTEAFDFEGSMDPGIAYSYSLYGAQPTTYYQVTRCPNPLFRAIINHKK